jgi:hypothetical protein
MKTAFWDLKEQCTCAERVRDSAFTCRHGRLGFYAAGARANFTTPSTNTVRITVGLRNKTDAAKNFCSTVSQSFRTKKNALVFP